MGKYSKKSILIADYGLSQNDFYEIKRQGRHLTILRKTGVDKIMESSDLHITGLKIISTVAKFILDGNPVDNVPHFTAVVKGERLGEDGSLEKYFASASAYPGNSEYDRYPEIAEKRARHRIVLEAEGLYKLDIRSVDEDPSFKKINKDSAVRKSVADNDTKSAAAQMEEAMALIKKRRAATKKAVNARITQSVIAK
jgi:hypothetical protein